MHKCINCAVRQTDLIRNLIHTMRRERLRGWSHLGQLWYRASCLDNSTKVYTELCTQASEQCNDDRTWHFFKSDYQHFMKFCALHSLQSGKSSYVHTMPKITILSTHCERRLFKAISLNKGTVTSEYRK